MSNGSTASYRWVESRLVGLAGVGLGLGSIDGSPIGIECDETGERERGGNESTQQGKK